MCIFPAPLARILMADTKSNVSAPLPYKRVSSAAQFRALIPGRRKAMEVSTRTTINTVSTASELDNSGHGHVPSVRLTRSCGRKRRREKIILISATGTFFLGLQTQDCLFVKLCLDLRQPTRPLGRERWNESRHQLSIRFAQSVVLNACQSRTARGKGPTRALVITLLRCYAFHF